MRKLEAKMSKVYINGISRQATSNIKTRATRFQGYNDIQCGRSVAKVQGSSIKS